MGPGGTMYPAESWALRGRAHEFFVNKGRCVDLTASPTTGVPNTTTSGVAIFDQYAAISRKGY